MPENKTISVLLVAMLILAGCTTTNPSTDTPIEASPQEVSTETSAPTPTATPTATPKQTTTPTPSPTVTPTERGENEDAEQAVLNAELRDNSEPITDDTRRVITNLSRDFYEGLPTNESERKTETVRAARTLCSKSARIDSSVFETSGEFDRQSYRLYHATNTVNEHFNKEVSTTKLQSTMSSAGSLSKYTPLVGSYNRMYDASCAVEPGDDESLERFYVASASFGVEAALVQQQVFFKTSFVATRYTTNRLSLMKVRTVTGDKGYGLLLSEIHWAYRGGQTSATSYIFSKSADLDIDVSEMDRETIREAANDQYEKHRANAEQGLEDGRAVAENTTRVMEECAELSESEESSGFWDKAGDRVNDVADDLKSGLQNVSEVDANDIPEHVNESIDNPREFASCVDERIGD
jgi:hypothetical protein